MQATKVPVLNQISVQLFINNYILSKVTKVLLKNFLSAFVIGN
jgi:hypothetical protein